MFLATACFQQAPVLGASSPSALQQSSEDFLRLRASVLDDHIWVKWKQSGT